MVSEILKAYNENKTLIVSGRVHNKEVDSGGQVAVINLDFKPFTIKKGDRSKTLGFGLTFSKAKFIEYLEKAYKNKEINIRKTSNAEKTIYLIDSKDGNVAFTVEVSNA